MRSKEQGQSDVRGRVLTFRVGPDEHRTLSLLARAEGVSLSEAIRQAVIEKADRLVRQGAEVELERSA